MADLTPARRNVQLEEVQYKAAVSEATFQKLGSSVNFINYYQYYPFYFGLAGEYSSSSLLPGNNIGFIETFDYNAEIVNVRIYSGAAGTSGTTEVDIKWAAAGSTSFSSIFSTTPKVTSSAASGAQFDINGVDGPLPSGCTKPVLSKSQFTAGNKLRLDVVSKMAGAARDFIVIIFWRPR